MKKIITFLIFIAAFASHAQVLKPVKWTTSVNKISDTEYELVATATIDKGWHLYSQTVPEDGPIATSFTFEGNTNYLKKGNTSEDKGHTVQDPVFDMEITYFDKKANFKQRIKLKGKVPFVVKGTVEFMVCDDSRCLPPTEVDLVFNVK
ncbi:thiol:disulfide interchange protein DsbD [Mariniflexile fucanivorans]|uniref:Thiol:disulfide interchange protein DsbD n=1 Tax=Mariniflexile fucanivorans TaxID=264023 RepID=A0A4R1RBQ5_9FLAO|nr:protein-disulfide reductase DsbD domain-containing protein [Mariniflexile fucanivorans]TCL63176.1 thiol:disulfide interchange protein DsbD [Mariniflexile fucanivorans]